MGPATPTTLGLNGMRGTGFAGEPDYKEGQWKVGQVHHGGFMDIVGIDISKATFDVALLLGRHLRHAAFSNTEAQHRHQEFVRFLNAIERAVPAGKLIHAIADNYATYKHPKVRAWLERYPRWVFHFTLTSASWINAVEGFFSTLTRQRLKRGVFRSVADLEQAIAGYIREHNGDPKPFVWTKPAKAILDKLSRLPELSF